MNPIHLHSLRRLAPILLSVLLLSAAPLYAQSTPAPTPDASPSPSAATTLTVTTPPTATADSVLAPAATSTATLPVATSTATAPAAISTATAAPIPTSTPAPIVPATAIPPGTGGGNDRLVPLLLGGLFLLAALAIGGLLLMRRRRPRGAVGASPGRGRPPTTPLPPVGAETVTGVLMPVYLQLEGDAPQSFAINETPFAIGRDPANNLPIDESFPGWQTVSRQHALISRHERGYVIEDLGSQNGVRVNGRLTPKNLLRNGWQVSIGGVAFRFVDETQIN
ncbi:MAG: FHA domain-containing protein [Candidatus Promineofilum sp.]|nr:FHA domain-containing protein [Promineifilum sp.]